MNQSNLSYRLGFLLRSCDGTRSMIEDRSLQSTTGFSPGSGGHEPPSGGAAPGKTRLPQQLARPDAHPEIRLACADQRRAAALPTGVLCASFMRNIRFFKAHFSLGRRVSTGSPFLTATTCTACSVMTLVSARRYRQFASQPEIITSDAVWRRYVCKISKLSLCIVIFLTFGKVNF